MKNSITKFADATIADLSAVIGGGSKGNKAKCKSKSKSKKSKSKKSGSKGGGYCPPNPCW